MHWKLGKVCVFSWAADPYTAISIITFNRSGWSTSSLGFPGLFRILKTVLISGFVSNSFVNLVFFESRDFLALFWWYIFILSNFSKSFFVFFSFSSSSCSSVMNPLAFLLKRHTRSELIIEIRGFICSWAGLGFITEGIAFCTFLSKLKPRQ